MINKKWFLLSLIGNLIISSCGFFGAIPVAVPEIDPPGGSYSSNLVISITTSTRGAEIRYTLDGKDPSPERGFLYSNPFSITDSKTVKAVAFKQGWADSEIVTETYHLPELPKLLEFRFSWEDNSSYLLAGVSGVVREADKTVIVEIPLGTVLSDLRASFSSLENTVVKLGDVFQESGITSNNFSNPVVYSVINEKGDRSDYTVTLSETGSIVSSTRTGTFQFMLDFKNSSRDIYFILTNPDADNPYPPPSIFRNAVQYNSLFSRSALFPPRVLLKKDIPEGFAIPPVSGKPEITEFNNNPPVKIRDDAIKPKNITPITEPLRSAVGDQVLFNTTNIPVSATCRKVSAGINTLLGQKTLYIWVEDASWYQGGNNKVYFVDQSMVDQVAERFLTEGLGNDIYDWISGIFGEEWGNHGYSNLIDPSDEIHILINDIDEDGNVNQTGGVLGYFWARDNYKKDLYPESNERIMFYLDSVFLATPEGASWDITNQWPERIISALAHEFQHMINFYQKWVIFGANPETWLNEMCSLAAEDFVADKLGVPGPRGIDPADYSAGSPPVTSGRLPLFNYYNDDELTFWPELDYEDEYRVYRSYAIAYAFGAYIARNFGGAILFRNIVQSDKTSTDAVESALALAGYRLSFGEVLRQWGMAVVLSARMDAPSQKQYNLGGPFNSLLGGVNFSLGSVNLYNYSLEIKEGTWHEGPYFWPEGEIGYGNPVSNGYFREVQAVSGTWQFNIPKGYLLTYVAVD